MDMQAIYPQHLIPTFMNNLRDFYVGTYKDQFYVMEPAPAFFQAFLWMELLYEVPVMVWALGALWNSELLFRFTFSFFFG
jgi:hypothetical protein